MDLLFFDIFCTDYKREGLDFNDFVGNHEQMEKR